MFSVPVCAPVKLFPVVQRPSGAANMLVLNKLFGQSLFKALAGSGSHDIGQLFLMFVPTFHMHHLTCWSRIEKSDKVLACYWMQWDIWEEEWVAGVLLKDFWHCFLSVLTSSASLHPSWVPAALQVQKSNSKCQSAQQFQIFQLGHQNPQKYLETSTK